MAFRATATSLSVALEQIEQAAAGLKRKSTSYKSEIDGIGSNFYAVNGYLVDLKNALDLMDSLVSTPGLAQYAKDQRNDQYYDIAAEYTALKATIQSAGDWITNALNAQPSLVTFGENWSATPAAFTAQQVAPLVTRINSVISAID